VLKERSWSRLESRSSISRGFRNSRGGLNHMSSRRRISAERAGSAKGRQAIRRRASDCFWLVTALATVVLTAPANLAGQSQPKFDSVAIGAFDPEAWNGLVFLARARQQPLNFALRAESSREWPEGSFRKRGPDPWRRSPPQTGVRKLIFRISFRTPKPIVGLPGSPCRLFHFPL
jgi:hypothetical protein